MSQPGVEEGVEVEPGVEVPFPLTVEVEGVEVEEVVVVEEVVEEGEENTVAGPEALLQDSRTEITEKMITSTMKITTGVLTGNAR